MSVDKKQRIPPDVIEKARAIDLYTYLKVYEPNELVSCGNGEYCLRSHDSLKISNGKWHWWSRDIGGASALDFLVKVRGMEFRKAVEMLTGGTIKAPPVSVSQSKKKPTRIWVQPFNFKCQKAKPYLLSRGISENIVVELISKKLIGEGNANGDVLFFGYDERGRIKHCSARATDGTQRKSDAYGSKKEYTFNLLSKAPRDRVLVFESAIDLLSFATILEDYGLDYKQENLISVAGIYARENNVEQMKVPPILERILKANPQISKIVLYFDNDRTGKLCASCLQKVLGDRYDVKYSPPPDGKDYNEFLQKKYQFIRRKTRIRNEDMGKDER